jgi:hypothetical protein
MDINMAKLCLNAICVTFHKAYSLSIVTLKSLLGVKCEGNVMVESVPVL